MAARRSQRAFGRKAKPAPATGGITVEYPVIPARRNEWSTPGGVVIDDVCYQFQGEPKPYPLSVHFGGVHY